MFFEGKTKVSDTPWLLVGLGNPGREYARNRHNIGFMAVDEIAREYGFPIWKRKFQGQMAEGRIAGEKVILLKPETYMNLSGEAAGTAARFYKIPPERIWVFHDEMDLPPGRLRTKHGGGSGGHNGIKSLDQHLTPAYGRVRLGVGHPGDKDRVTGHVTPGGQGPCDGPCLVGFRGLGPGLAGSIAPGAGEKRALAARRQGRIVDDKAGRDKAVTHEV